MIPLSPHHDEPQVDIAERVQAAIDAANIRQAHEESLHGKGMDVDDFFVALREKLQAMNKPSG